MEAKFAQAGSSLHGKLEGSVGNLKAWVMSELRSFGQVFEHRFKNLETKQAEVSARISSKCKRERDFETKVQQRFMTMEKVVMNCMNGLHAVGQKVECGENSSGLSELRTELARFQADALERARREGEMHVKIQTLEKKCESRASTPPPAVSPPRVQRLKMVQTDSRGGPSLVLCLVPSPSMLHAQSK